MLRKKNRYRNVVYMEEKERMYIEKKLKIARGDIEYYADKLAHARFDVKMFSDLLRQNKMWNINNKDVE